VTRERLTITLRGHEYVVPHVTEVCDTLAKGPGFSEYLMKYGERAKAISREARDRGTTVHEAARMHLKGVPRLPGSEELVAEQCAALITKWIAANVTKVYFAEQPVYSRQWLYGGRPDLVCELRDYPGRVCVVDYKTTRADEVYPAWSAQVAAYCYSDEVQAIERQDLLGAVLRIDWETLEEPVLTMVPNLKNEFQAFLHLLAVWNLLDKRKAVKIRAQVSSST